MKIDTIDIENHFLILRDAYGYSSHLEREDGTAHGGVLTVTNIYSSSIEYFSTLLSALKKVQVTYDEYQERGSSEVGMFDLSTQDGYEKMYEWHRKGNLRLEDINNGWSWDNGYDQGLNEEQKYWLKHVWGDGEVYHAESYKDITIVEQYNGEGSKEYYSTPEIIEVLEKWIEVLERWNNPEERKKMIVEYEANEQKKIQDFRD